MRKVKETKQDRINKILKMRPQMEEYLKELARERGYTYQTGRDIEEQLFRDMMVFDTDKLRGFRVRLMVNEDGDTIDSEWLEDMGMTSTEGIVRDFNGDHSRFSIDLPDYGGWTTYPEYIQLIDDITLIYPTDVKNLLQDLTQRRIERAIYLLDRFRNQQKYNLESALQNHKSNVEYHKEELKRQQEELKSCKDKLENLVVEPFTKDTLKLQILKLKKHKYVDNAYLSDQGKITVLTKPLINIDPLSNKKGRFNIGRFWIEITVTEGGRAIRVYNLDYAYLANPPRGFSDKYNVRYYHPNIKAGQVCWGEHEQYIATLITQGNFFVFIDFIIKFLSIYPHDTGSPFIQFDTWKRHRKKIPQGGDEGVYLIGKELKKW